MEWAVEVEDMTVAYTTEPVLSFIVTQSHLRVSSDLLSILSNDSML